MMHLYFYNYLYRIQRSVVGVHTYHTMATGSMFSLYL